MQRRTTSRTARQLLRALLFAGAACGATPANALTFPEALALARDNEPTYLSAKANFAAVRERERQALGGLLPQVTASASSNDNHRNWDTRNPLFSPEVTHFRSNNAQISLTQPLWRHSNLIALSQSEALAAQAEFQLLTAEQELYAKLVGAWLECMTARDGVTLAERAEATAREQWDAARRGADLGTGSTPAREDARAKYDQAQSDRVTASMELNGKIAALEQLVGSLPAFEPPQLAQEFQARDLTQESLDGWLSTAENHSPQIAAARHALDAANEEIRKQSAGHEPTLDLVASYMRNGQGAGNFPGQNGYDIRQNALGLQLNIPLYAGGTQGAKVNEAIALRDKATHELEAARRAIRLAAKQAWYGWTSANARQRAALQAVSSAALALKAATTGKAKGLNIELDRLQAAQQVASARRDLNKARGEMMSAIFKLKAAAGQMTEADLIALAELFVVEDAPSEESL